MWQKKTEENSELREQKRKKINDNISLTNAK